ncbi:MAG: 4-hydroxy-tetrahydrodipicolinate synthase [Symbiobacteriaceae bacterium]|jgi:4-hydroxy-tetrahydrodipicolinate synthase|nr:4-hydroxy-tetrahydrodipicolinate synthase [Symbiobacteriaceae bacterium]
MFQAKGIIPAIVTPFTPAEEVNEAALRQLVRRMLKGGVHGVFALGTNGEFFAMSYEEKVQVAQIVVDEVAGKVPVYLGAGGVTTRETIALAQAFAKIGADALSVITPWFLPFTQGEMVTHFTRLAAATDLPIVLYNIPARAGVALNPPTVAQLAKIDNIVGIKDSSGSFDNILKYISSTEKDFSVLAGTDSLILPALMSGGQGAIAATANLLPEVVVSVYNHFQAGDFAKAQEAQAYLAPIRNLFASGTLPSVLKESLNMTGIPVGPARRPVAPISDAVRADLLKVLQGYAAAGLVELA